eukprot:3411733-Rhodomonas_salina.1
MACAVWMGLSKRPPVETWRELTRHRRKVNTPCEKTTHVPRKVNGSQCVGASGILMMVSSRGQRERDQCQETCQKLTENTL